MPLKSNTYSIKFGDFIIEEPEAVEKGNFFSKVGCMNMKGHLHGKKINIYECHNSQHAQFIQEVTSREETKKYFPYIYGIHNNFILSEWVEGKKLKPKHIANKKHYIEQINDLYNTLHNNSYAKDSGFNYFEDHIFSRFQKCCETINLPDFFDKISKDYHILKNRAKTQYISHPDITPSNIIITPEQQIKIIDNELLCSSFIPNFDYFNLIYGFGDSLTRNAKRWRTLFDPLKQDIFNGYDNQYLSLWIMRICGSSFLEGNIKKIITISEKPYEQMKKSMNTWQILNELINAG